MVQDYTIFVAVFLDIFPVFYCQQAGYNPSDEFSQERNILQ